VIASQLESAHPATGESFELNAIAAVVLGGTSLMGGRGSIGGSLIGAFVIGVLADGLVMMGVSEFWQIVIKGVVIVSGGDGGPAAAPLADAADAGAVAQPRQPGKGEDLRPAASYRWAARWLLLAGCRARDRGFWSWSLCPRRTIRTSRRRPMRRRRVHSNWAIAFASMRTMTMPTGRTIWSMRRSPAMQPS
jgi:hypothetical protein